jgi:outer membrane protein TolC
VHENELALKLSETQYRVGVVDMRAVKMQQVDLYQARMQWLSLQSERIAQRVNLYLALGGDFGTETVTPASGVQTSGNAVAGK